VQIHHGTRQLGGRVALLDAASKNPASPRRPTASPRSSPTRRCTPAAATSSCCATPTARNTLGGGRILDPFGPPRHRRHPDRLAVLAALAVADPAERLQALLACSPLGVDLAQLAAAENRRPDALLALLPEARPASTTRPAG
jgi:selenocysteine-specific elongation factor